MVLYNELLSSIDGFPGNALVTPSIVLSTLLLPESETGTI